MNLCAVAPTPAILPPLAAALQMLEEAQTVDQVSELRDQAEAIRQLFRRRKDSLERQNDAAEIKLRAERKLGELLSETSARGRWLRDEITGQVRGAERSLPAGVTPIQSHRWQRIASVPEASFERWITQTRAAGDELTQVALLRLAEQYIRKDEDDLTLNCEGTNCEGTDDDEPTSQSDTDTQDEDTANYPRPVILGTSVIEREQLLADCESLMDAYGTTNVTSTVLECVRRAVEEE